MARTTAELNAALSDLSDKVGEAGTSMSPPAETDVGGLVVDPSNPNTDAAVGASDLLLERWQKDDGSTDTFDFTTEPTTSEANGYEDCFVADSFSFGVEREMGGIDDLLIGGSTTFDEGPEESITFVYGKMDVGYWL